MSRLNARLTRLESRQTPKRVYCVLNFDPAGMSREEIRAEVARRRGVDPSTITVLRAFANMPEPMEDTQEWLAKYAPGGTEWARWGKWRRPAGASVLLPASAKLEPAHEREAAQKGGRGQGTVEVQ